MIESGACRQVNVITTYAKNCLDFALGSLAALMWGYYLAYGVDAWNFGLGDPRQARRQAERRPSTSPRRDVL
jgi:ammonia channel protein AmtB